MMVHKALKIKVVAADGTVSYVDNTNAVPHQVEGAVLCSNPVARNGRHGAARFVSADWAQVTCKKCQKHAPVAPVETRKVSGAELLEMLGITDL